MVLGRKEECSKYSLGASIEVILFSSAISDLPHCDTAEKLTEKQPFASQILLTSVNAPHFSLLTAFIPFTAALKTPAEEANMVSFILPVAEVPPKVLFVKKVVKRDGNWTHGWGAEIHPSLPGCVQPGREGVGELRSHLPQKNWVYAWLWIAHRVHPCLDSKFQVRTTSVTHRSST